MKLLFRYASVGSYLINRYPIDHDQWCIDTYVSIDMNFSRSKGPFETLQIQFVKKITAHIPTNLKSEVQANKQNKRKTVIDFLSISLNVS